MKNQNLLDQFFLTDENVIEKLVESASVDKNDIVLEIGAGKGVVTRKIAPLAKKVITIEIDRNFFEELRNLPKNVEVIFGDALEILEERLIFNKIVASLPSSVVEPLMNRLYKFDFETASFLIPLKFVEKLLNDQIFSIYFQTEMVDKVAKDSFAPQPKTNWAIIKIIKVDDPLSDRDYGKFIRRYLFEHKAAKTKNSLMEAIIMIFKSKGKALTKNQARELVAKANFSKKLLENPSKEKDYLEISERVLEILHENPL